MPRGVQAKARAGDLRAALPGPVGCHHVTAADSPISGVAQPPERRQVWGPRSGARSPQTWGLKAGVQVPRGQWERVSGGWW